MTQRMLRCFTMALLASQLLFQGCGDNDPSVRRPDAAPDGRDSGLDVPADSGGSGGKTGSGGIALDGGDDDASQDASDDASGAGGEGGAGGDNGSGGASGSGGSSNSNYSPSCTGLTTAAGPAPTKGGACVAEDPQLCWKTCGPENVGFKSETCNEATGSYEEGGCEFPPENDYSCYKIPSSIDSSCPTTTPKASQACTVSSCVLCNVAGSYYDSGGSLKSGYCVCNSLGKWSCASATAWPCPGKQGC